MKINRRKIIALITLISMFMAYFIPAEGLTLLAPAPEIVIEVEEIDEPDNSVAEKSDKEEGSENGSAVNEKEADGKDKPGSEPLTEAEKSDKEEGSAVSEKDADNKDKPDSGASADTEKPEKETATEAVTDTEKPEKETSTEAVIDTEKPEEPKTEAPTETAKPETEKETAKPTAKPEGTEKPEDDRLIIQGSAHEHNKKEFTEWTATDSLPTEAGNYCLTADVTISSRWDVPSGTTNLCLNGHAIIRTAAEGTTGSVIQVGSGATLNLYDCGTETRYYTVANPTANGAGLGTVVDKSTYDAADKNARGTFTGGYITGGNITGATDNAHLIGGGFNVYGGNFTMYGGTVIGNKVCINGGVKVKGKGASFTMNGGAILANHNDCYGGAISIGDNIAENICTVNINGDSEEYCRKSLSAAMSISKEKTLGYIEQLYCEPKYKARIKELAN